MWRQRRISPRSHCSKPPQTGQDLTCTAETMQSLIRKALTPRSTPHFLCQHHVFFHRIGSKRSSAAETTKGHYRPGSTGSDQASNPPSLSHHDHPQTPPRQVAATGCCQSRDGQPCGLSPLLPLPVIPLHPRKFRQPVFPTNSPELIARAQLVGGIEAAQVDLQLVPALRENR